MYPGMQHMIKWLKDADIWERKEKNYCRSTYMFRRGRCRLASVRLYTKGDNLNNGVG